MPSVDHYQILGVVPSATVAEIRTAYWRLAQQHHPDHGGDPERMKELNAAWGVLGHPRRRAAYDRERQAEAQSVAQEAARKQARRQARHGKDPHPLDDDPWEPQGTWWDEAAYRRRATQHDTGSTAQAPPNRQSAQGSRVDTGTGPASWKDVVAGVIPMIALVVYLGLVQDAWRGGTGWHWLTLVIITGPFWGIAIMAQLTLRNLLGD